jgi:alkanesulfonate monooxygenase SsuD/methylene tetrahydromethanopterin reductase-like flavin-dependent oxidoreductase (luciferase family)
VAPRIGYLLPTREQIMEGRPAARPLLELAARAEGLGFDSVWIGDSLTARPRHDPLTLMAAVAARVPRVEIGTAVLLPALRNPVLLAHQAATIDQISEGRLILGVGIASDAPSIRAEFEAAGVPFEKRVGRMMEGLRLCRALWRGEPVDWDGRWVLRGATVAPVPHRAGGPLLWIGGHAPASLERAGRFFDAWFPLAPDPAGFAAGMGTVRAAAVAARRAPGAVGGAMYLTVALAPSAAEGEARLDAFLSRYYNRPGAEMRARQACYAGPEEGLAARLAAYAAAGVGHFCLRFAGDAEAQMDAVARVRRALGW